jgi:hypothetical protein
MTIRATVNGAVILGLGLALGLGGCNTMPTATARGRIVQAPTRCADETVQIYFETFSSDVTKEGKAVIAAAAQQARPCKVTGVDVLGLADSVGGAADSNLELSKRRAEAVTAALSAAGLPAAEFKITAVGEKGSTTADGRSRPLRRRADIAPEPKERADPSKGSAQSVHHREKGCGDGRPAWSPVSSRGGRRRLRKSKNSRPRNAFRAALNFFQLFWKHTRTAYTWLFYFAFLGSWAVRRDASRNTGSRRTFARPTGEPARRRANGSHPPCRQAMPSGAVRS